MNRNSPHRSLLLREGELVGLIFWFSLPDDQRVIVFIDARTVYHGARSAFFSKDDYHVHVQFHPLALGRLLVQRGNPGISRAFRRSPRRHRPA